jgi:hypothetical protein
MEHTARVMQQQMAEPVHVQRLDLVRDWKQVRDQIGITGIIGMAGKGSPHFFRFCKRRHLPVNLLEHAEPGHPEDVLLEVKEFMASQNLAQPIQVAIPGAHLRIPIPDSVVQRSAITKAQAHGSSRYWQAVLRGLET